MPIPTLWLCVTFNTEIPVLDVTSNGSRVVVPFTVKETVEDVALIPATVPLSKAIPVEMVFAPVHLVTYPFVPLPVTCAPPNSVDVAVHW